MKGIITICGSTKFRKEFESVNAVLTLKGYSILTVGVFGHAIKNKDLREVVWDDKIILDQLHKEKIDMSFLSFVIDVDGYIGTSTRAEIDHTLKNKKPVVYLRKELNDVHAQIFDDLDRTLYRRLLSE